MIKVEIKGLDAVRAHVAGMGKQVRFAAAVALTKTAKAVEVAEKREMRDVFDRPTPNTMNSTYVKPATPQTLAAEIGIKNFAGKGIAADKYLAAQIKGGSRRMKRFEKALQSVGALPDGYRAVPGAAAKMDAFGNMQGGQIVQILSFFKAFPEMGYKANMSDKRRMQLAKGSKKSVGFAYFVGRPGDRLPLGIYQRFNLSHGSAIKPVIIFVPHATYQAVFDFKFVAAGVVDREWARQFDSALTEAMRTAR